MKSEEGLDAVRPPAFGLADPATSAQTALPCPLGCFAACSASLTGVVAVQTAIPAPPHALVVVPTSLEPLARDVHRPPRTEVSCPLQDVDGELGDALPRISASERSHRLVRTSGL